MKSLSFLKKYYDNGDPSHDWSHIQRVVGTCKIFSAELGANLRVLLPAAYLHDIINIPKDSEQRSIASQIAATKARELLKNLDFSNLEIDAIAQVIIEHSYSANIAPSSLESKILQDADKLDGMGAIGVMRWATVGSRLGASYYHESDPFALNRDIDDKKYSLDHFEAKLLKLYERLNTAQGKTEGKRRLDFFHSFLKQLKSEIS